jgi:prepilin-type processing-associated H-X9-DG protein
LRCQNNLKQIGLALAHYESSLGCYPFGVGGTGVPGRIPRWSAQSQLLPYLEQQALFSSLNFSFLPWVFDPVLGAPNTTVVSTRIAGFLCPSDSGNIEGGGAQAPNSYRASAGTRPYNLAADSPDGSGRNDGAFWFQSSVRAGQVSDGLSVTGVFSERCLGTLPRIEPKSVYSLVDVSPESCAAAGAPGSSVAANFLEQSGGRWSDGSVCYARYHHLATPNKNSCYLGGVNDFEGMIMTTPSSRHPGGVNLLLGDGSVHFIKDGIDPATWKALGTIAGGDAVDKAGF